MKKIKVAVSQRIIPQYRVPVFKELSSRKHIDLTVFYGEGLKHGSQVNASRILGFNAIKLFTIFLNFKGRYGSTQLRVWHPSLLYYLIRGNYDAVIVEPSSNFYNDTIIYIYCKVLRKKFIWYESGSQSKDKRTLFRRLIDPFISIFIKGSDSYITYNSYADKYLTKYFSVSDRKIFRAQNTIDTSNFDNEIKHYTPLVTKKREELGLKDCKVTLYMGGIERRKKINNLITATTNLKYKGILAKTLIVGNGPDIDYLKRNMTEEEHDHSVFAGKHIEDAVLYILVSDVVVLPSLGGLTVMQAFACAKPFIGSKEIENGGINDYVQHGINGFLIKENDIIGLTGKLEKIFTNADLYNLLSKNAYKKSKEITIHKMVDGIENAINYSIKS